MPLLIAIINSSIVLHDYTIEKWWIVCRTVWYVVTVDRNQRDIPKTAIPKCHHRKTRQIFNFNSLAALTRNSQT